MKDRRWYRRLTYFYNIVNGNCPEYLKKYVPSKQYANKSKFRIFISHTEYYKNSFFSFCVNEWNKLDPSIRNSTSISIFKNALLKFIRPKCCPVYKIFDPIGLKLLTRLRLNLSHLREHKFRHNFQDTLNPLCSCKNLETETTGHYFLRCDFYTNTRTTLLENLVEIVGNMSFLFIVNVCIE